MQSVSVCLNRYINHGEVSEDDFGIKETAIEGQVSGSVVLLDLIYISVESNYPNLSEGTYVSGLLPWKTPQLVDAASAQLRRIDNPHKFPLSYFLGDLGMTGWTAYASLKEIGQPKQGDVLFVSGAAGAVGSAVGQLAKHLWGCKVIGSAGSDAKVAFVKEQLGFDAAFNYKTTSTDEALSQHAPNGINIYYDNVGGETLETAIEHCANHARIVCCGAISGYDKPKEQLYGVRNLFNVVTKRLTLKGFIVGDYPPQSLRESVEAMSSLIEQGKFKVVQDVVEGGLAAAGAAFVGLMKGENTGKRLVAIGQDEFK